MVINSFEPSRRYIARHFNAVASQEYETRTVAGSKSARGLVAPAWIALTLVLLVASGWFLWTSGVWETVTSPERFRAVIQGFGTWAPVVYVLAKVVQVIVPPIPGSIFPPVAATVFGPQAALALSMAGTTIGSAIVFALARMWGRRLLERIVSPEILDNYAGVITARGGLWLFVIMLLPFLPDDAVCAMVGSSAISFRRFLILTTLGRLPTTVLGVYLVSAPTPNPAAFWLPAVMLLLVPPILSIRYRNRLEAWLFRRSSGHE